MKFLPFALTAPFILLSPGVQSADENTPQPAPKPNVSVEVAPPPRFRQISPEEARAALERVIKQRMEEGKPAPEEFLHMIEDEASASPDPQPTPGFVMPVPPREAIPVKAMRRVGDREAGPPKWEMEPEESRLPLHRDKDFAEVILRNEWRNLRLSVELKAAHPGSKPIRALFREPGMERVQVEPGVRHTLVIHAWLPERMAPRQLYIFEDQFFDRGRQYGITLDADMAQDVIDYLNGPQPIEPKIVDIAPNTR